MSLSTARIQIGCCGFALAQARYFAAFSCVEIDTSFYQLPRRETVARWRAAAPPGFQFAMKAWQVITHRATSPTYRRTRIDPREADQCGEFGYNATVRWAWAETRAIAEELGAFLVLFQCPASFRPNRDNLARLRQFFERAPRGRLQLGWEPRGAWQPELVRDLCRDLGLIPVADPFQGLPAAVGPFRYYRLHGPGGPRHRYRDEHLAQLREFCQGRTPAYCLFNNVAMAADASRFRRLLPPPA